MYNKSPGKSTLPEIAKVIVEIQNTLPSGARFKSGGPILSMRNDNRVTEQSKALIQYFLLIAFRTNQIGWVDHNA